mgnify:CR=1 FL=1
MAPVTLSTNLYCLVYQPIILQGGGLASEQQSRLDLPSPGKESNSYSNNKFPGRSVEAMDQRSEVCYHVITCAPISELPSNISAVEAGEEWGNHGAYISW